ncbi:MAG TPA: hypothetical protein VJ648_00125 [Vicinamibacteria bacterium]|nr:hypothetical protein [Vicinamibacteria bacterium]
MKRAAAIAIALSALALLADPALASEKAALGTWDIVASTPDGPLPSVMTVTKVEGKLKAEIDLGGIKRTVSDEALEGDVLKLKVEYEGVVYAIQGQIAGDAMEGTWEGGGNSGSLKAKRRP